MIRRILVCASALTLLLFFTAPMISASTNISKGSLVVDAQFGALPDFTGNDAAKLDDWLKEQGISGHGKTLSAYGASEPCIEDDCCVHITTDGSIGRIRVEDCPLRDWDISYVLADALGTLKIDMEHINFKVDPNAKISLNKDEIWGMLKGATATIPLASDISMKLDFHAMKGVLSLPGNLSGLLDVPTWTASITLSDALIMNLNLKDRTVAFFYKLSGHDEISGPFGFSDPALQGAINNLEAAGLINAQSKQELLGLLATIQTTLAKVGALFTITDIYALIPDYYIPLSELDFSIEDSADWSSEIEVPYSFGFVHSDMKSDASTEFRLKEDVLDISWPDGLSQHIEEKLTLGQMHQFLESLFPQSSSPEEINRIISEITQKESAGIADLETEIMECLLDWFKGIVDELIAMPTTSAGVPLTMAIDFDASSMDNVSSLVSEKTAEWIGIVFESISIDIKGDIEFEPGIVNDIVLLGASKYDVSTDDGDGPNMPYSGGTQLNTPLILLIGADLVLGGLLLRKKEKQKS